MLQALLGNIGRPGGDLLALRGHVSIQGSTDIATLYHSLPGYLNMPDGRRPHDTLKDFILTEAVPLSTSYWGNYPKFAVSYFKTRYGDAVTRDNNYGYDYHQSAGKGFSESRSPSNHFRMGWCSISLSFVMTVTLYSNLVI